MSKIEKKKIPPDFEEEWVKVENGKVEIMWYYFPIATSLVVDISKIKRIKIVNQDKSYSKNWGSNGATWWACDMKRNFRSLGSQFYNVKLDTGEFFQKGFTVKDVHGFLNAIRNDLVERNIIFK